MFGDSTKGQRAVYEMGRTGIPVVNCNNNCATGQQYIVCIIYSCIMGWYTIGSTALLLSRQLVAGNLAQCALALGFEKMQVWIM